ncbi:MAG: sensor histidine kinase [Solirubrobacterales bacterium]
MNIKKRLIISNIITVIIPFFIVFIVGFGFMLTSSKVFHTDINYNKFKTIVAVKSELVSSIKNISELNPENIEDSKFQGYIYTKLAAIKGELIITKGDKTIFASKELSSIDIEKCLEEENPKNFRKPITIDNISYEVESSELHFKDGAKGVVILLAPIENNSQLLNKLVIALIIIFIITFIVVDMIMSYLYSIRILKPIAHLKKALNEISKGDLNFEIIEYGDREIQELCADFEHMRIQLKDSVQEKMKYDDNRKVLISSISHDLKTPITSIKGYVEGILDGIANTPEKQELYLKTIYSKAEQIDSMIDDLLLYSKLDLNQIPFNFEKTDIVSYFDYCISEYSIELQKYNIYITLENQLVNSRYVRVDRERFRRVIVNIIDNSRKYMDKVPGQIDIMLRETNNSIIIEIRDNGSGIEKDDINKIFNRFYRADAARTETKGSGLGLAIAKQIVEGHKGKIWAVSHGNEGTSIIISLAKIS